MWLASLWEDIRQVGRTTASRLDTHQGGQVSGQLEEFQIPIELKEKVSLAL